MRIWSLTRFPSWLTSLLVLGATLPAIALQTSTRTTFEAPPRLTDTVTTFNQVRVRGAKYYFSFVVPPEAGEPLNRIEIEQRPAPDEIDFELEDTFAFVGTRNNREERLTLSDVSLNEETNTLAITFDPPIPPGTAFTVGLEPERNPFPGGTYLFRVRAFPAGNDPYGLDLGVGRLQFYENFDFR